jgi:hypothetical protein
MKKWGYKGKVTKQMKLTFTEDKLHVILDHFKAKTARNAEYIAAAKELEDNLASAKEQATAGEDAW